MDAPRKFAAAAMASLNLLRFPVASPSLLWRLLWLPGASFGILWLLAPPGGRFSITKQAIQDVQMYEHVHILKICFLIQNRPSRTCICANMYIIWMSVRHYKTSDPGRADVRKCTLPGGQFAITKQAIQDVQM